MKRTIRPHRPGSRVPLILAAIIFVFVVLLLALPVAADPAAPQGTAMYVTDWAYKTVVRANLDGSGATSLGNLGLDLQGPGRIALDTRRGKMYFIDVEYTGWWPSKVVVIQANLDGTGAVELSDLDTTLRWPGDIAVDTVHDQLYFLDGWHSTVFRTNLDGSGVEDLGTLDDLLDEPWGMALDLDGGKMYVVNFNSSTLVQANLDGTGAVNMGDLRGTLRNPSDVAIDPVHGRLYFTNWSPDSVSTVMLDGSWAVSIGDLDGMLIDPKGIEVDPEGGKIYVINGGTTAASILWANLDGSGAVDLGNLGGTLYSPAGIALDLTRLGGPPTPSDWYLPMIMKGG